MPEIENSDKILERMRWLTFVLPSSFLFLLLFFAVQFLNDLLPNLVAVLVDFTIGALGIFFFSRSVFVVVERLLDRLKQQNRDLQSRSLQLRAVYEASRSITSNLSLAAVLTEVLNASRELVPCRYAALAIVEDGSITEMITSGLSGEERERIAEPEQGLGLLGHVLTTGRPYRSENIAADARAHGFPKGYPQMRTFLGMPITSNDTVIGNLYLADKTAGAFTAEDEEMVQILAVQAAIAIENARLYEATRSVAVLKERDRIGKELGDGAIQSLYAVDLMVENALEVLTSDPAQATDDLKRAMVIHNDVIRGFRSYIVELRPIQDDERSLRDWLEDLLRDHSVNTLMTTRLDAGEDECDPTLTLSDQQKHLLFEIANQALSNIRDHSQARNVLLTLSRSDTWLRLRIEDDGIGIDNKLSAGGGHGLESMASWARKLEGHVKVRNRKEGGTEVSISVPLEEECEREDV